MAEKALKTVDLDSLRKELKHSLTESNAEFEYFLTGNPMLDAFIGSGGLPKYQMNYIWAASSIGKSTLAIQILASYLKQAESSKHIVLYMDREESVTIQRLQMLGIDEPEKVVIINPDTIESVYEIIMNIRAKYDVDLYVIWDTLVQTPSAEELEGYSKIGMQARAFTEVFRKLKFYKSKLTMFSLDQFRENNFSGNQYMPKEPTGCNAVKHKSFVSWWATRKKSDLIDGERGYVTRLTSKKSKLASPHREMEFEVFYVTGYDCVLTALNFMRSEKIVYKKNGRFYFDIEADGVVDIEGFEPYEKGYKPADYYKLMMTDEAVGIWKFIVDRIYDVLYFDDDETFVKQAKERIINYYFKDNKIQLDRFTSINKKMLIDNVEAPPKSASVDNVLEMIDKTTKDDVVDDSTDTEAEPPKKRGRKPKS